MNPGRSGIVQLTRSGRNVAARWELLRSSAEMDWKDRIGPDDYQTLRASLECFVALLPLELSHYPCRYGAADARVTGGNGQDWKAISREPRDSVPLLALSALLSQALVAFAMAYEERCPVALSLSSFVIRRVPPAGDAAKNLGSAPDIAALTRHGFLTCDGNASGRIVRLTAKGKMISDTYDERVRAVEQGWRTAFGDALVTRMCWALENACRT